MTELVTHWQPPPPWPDDKPACYRRAGHIPVSDCLTSMRELVTCPACKERMP